MMPAHAMGAIGHGRSPEIAEEVQFSKAGLNRLNRMRYEKTDNMPFLHVLWMTLEEPSFSRAAYMYANFSMAIIGLSTICFCLETEFSCRLCNQVRKPKHGPLRAHRTRRGDELPIPRGSNCLCPALERRCVNSTPP